MNEQEKVNGLLHPLYQKEENARTEHLENRTVERHFRAWKMIGRTEAFSECADLVREIFGASERSGVGENEDQEQLIDLLKDALFSYQQYGELSDEVVERIEKSIHA